MPPDAQLDLAGYRGRRVPHTWVRQEEPTTRLAVFLPGFGYSCDMPLFYYAGLQLFARGVDILRVEYAYNRVPGFRELPAAEQRDWLLADARAALDAVSGPGQYQRLILVGKSLGTRAMGHLLTAAPLHQAVRAVWLTPLLRDAMLREQLRQAAVASLVVIGTADPHYDAAYLQELEETCGHATLVIPGADHSLDIDGDALGSIRALERVLAALGTFLSARDPVAG